MEKYIFLIVLFSPHSTKYTRIRGLRFNHSPKETLGWFWYLRLVIRFTKEMILGWRWFPTRKYWWRRICIHLLVFDSALYLSRLAIFLQTTTKQSDKQSCHLVSAPTPELAKLIVKSTFACVACGYSAVSVCDLFNLADVCRWLNCSSYFVFFDRSYFWLILWIKS